MTTTASSNRTTSRRRLGRPRPPAPRTGPPRPPHHARDVPGIVPRPAPATISAACRVTGRRGRLARWWAGSGRTWPSSRRSASWCSPCSRRTSTSAGCATACPRGPCWRWWCWWPPFLSIPLSRDGRGPSVHVDTPFVFALALAAGAGAAALVDGRLRPAVRPGPPQAVLQGGLQQRHPHDRPGRRGARLDDPGRRPGHRQLGPAGDPGRDGRVRRRQDDPVRRVPGPRQLRPAGGRPRPVPAPVLLVIVMAQVGVLVLVLAAERPALLLLALGPMLAAYLLLRSESQGGAGPPGRRGARPGGRPSCGPRSRRWPASSRRPTR